MLQEQPNRFTTLKPLVAAHSSTGAVTYDALHLHLQRDT
jgi:hypothetical protein